MSSNRASFNSSEMQMPFYVLSQEARESGFIKNPFYCGLEHPFTTELDWIEELLEENEQKRCQKEANNRKLIRSNIVDNRNKHHQTCPDKNSKQMAKLFCPQCLTESFTLSDKKSNPISPNLKRTHADMEPSNLAKPSTKKKSKKMKVVKSTNPLKEFKKIKPKLDPLFNPIGLLQELCAQNKMKLPIYTLQHTGSTRQPPYRFLCKVKINDDYQFKAIGNANSKKMAKRQAATECLKHLKCCLNF